MPRAAVVAGGLFEVSETMSNANEIVKVLLAGFRELDRKGELKRNGKRVATAINNLREERRLTEQQLRRRATI